MKKSNHIRADYICPLARHLCHQLQAAGIVFDPETLFNDFTIGLADQLP
ncbi:hypothetical protein [Lactobacillus delbrueckii]|nr:hypothetical protein [Lactobacillus delbrueckii]